MIDYQKILDTIEKCLENFQNPAINLSHNTDLGHYFNSTRNLEYQIDLLKGIIREKLQNSSALLSFIDKNLNTESFQYARIPFRIPKVQQLPELPQLEEEILDLSDETRWPYSLCQAWKDWFSRGDVYDAINTEFNNKLKTFGRNLTQLKKLLEDRIKQNGFIDMNIKKAEIQITPVDYTFVADAELQKILKRDNIDIQKCIVDECWKAVILLCGSSIEALLFDYLLNNEEKMKPYIPSGTTITELRLEQLINIARQCGIITLGVEKFSHSLRDYRNLIHPIKELKGDYNIDGPEARACLEVLSMVIRDVQKVSLNKSK